VGTATQVTRASTPICHHHPSEPVTYQIEFQIRTLNFSLRNESEAHVGHFGVIGVSYNVLPFGVGRLAAMRRSKLTDIFF
jgi:hypothetical protein